MGDPQNSTWWNEIVQGLGKTVMYLAYITIGVLTKLAFDSRNNALSRRQIVYKSVLSIFAGYMAAVICEKTGHENWGKIIIPVSTLLGESLVLYLMTNWKDFVDRFLPNWLKPKEKTKNNG